MDADLLEQVHSYISWVVQTKISDHFPIVFQWEMEGEHILYPFKFNATWLAMVNFDQFVRSTWRTMVVDDDLSPMRILVQKLRILKAAVKNWEKIQKARDSEELVTIEFDIAKILIDFPAGICDEEVSVQLKCLSESQISILKRKEETAHQKSRLKWNESGDSNTKFYHQFANARRIHNHIWDLQAEDGSVICKQGDLEIEAFTYFNSVYKKEENLSIVAQMELIMKYPRMFGEQDGERLFVPVTLKEIHSTLK